jgi:hypothetical protein
MRAGNAVSALDAAAGDDFARFLYAEARSISEPPS